MNITRFRQLLASPVFEGDDDKTRVAGLINTIAVSALAIDIIVIIILPIAQPGQSQPLYIVAIAVTLLLGILIAIRKGWVRPAGNFLTYGFWLLTTFAAVTSGGAHAPAFGTYGLSVVIAGLLLGWRAIVAVGSLSVLAAIAMVIAEQNGILPPPSFPITTESLLIAQTVSVFLSGVLLGLAIRSIERAFIRARLELQQRIETEKQLQQAEVRYRD